LYLGRPELARAGDTAARPLLEAATRHVAAAAEQFTASPEFAFNEHTHNSLLIRARIMQSRIVTLLVRWKQTGEVRFRDAVIEHVRQMGRWQYWSWITWRQGNDDPNAIFDLSYGENSATLAIAYTLLHDTLTDDEAQTFHDIAQRRALGPFLAHTAPGHEAGWFRRPDSNWNTVCAGGAGMLALAMHEQLEEAPEALKRSETSIAPFMRTLQDTGGAWPEGVGYWNYGMRYAFMYLLSHERATGEAHPLIEQPATAATLRFPLDFTPNKVACSFGDVNRWTPLPFHYAAAHRLKDEALIAALDRAVEPASPDPQRPPAQHWPNAAELLLLHPRTGAADDAPVAQRMLRRYHGQDWCILADRWPEPRLYASIRGGTTKVPHGHRDLLSFNLLVGREKLLENAQNAEYLDTTFSPRREELIEITPQGKNTVLVNGVGIGIDSTVHTTTFEHDALQAVRLDGTEAMSVSRGNEPAVTCCVRLFVLLEDDVLLVVDRIAPRFPGRAETRYLTTGALELHDDHRALVRGQDESLHAAFACDVPAALHTAQLPLISPNKSPTLNTLRWCTDDLHTTITMAAAFCANGEVIVQLACDDSHVRVAVERNGERSVLHATVDLQAPIIDS
ncbi:MAG: hypothetical protein ACODAQ_07160, partial [Phycisphaeraceae bacterium]